MSMRRRRRSGFTFIEMMVVMIIMMVIAFIGIPNLLEFIARSKVLTSAAQMQTLLRVARMTSIKTGKTVVVKALQASTAEGAAGEIFAFTDSNTNTVYDAPLASESRLDRDGNKLPGSLILPKGLAFAGPGGAAAAFSGFPTEASGKTGIIRFFPSGAAESVGAIRIRDNRSNILELRIDQTATARMTLRKFVGDPNGSDNVNNYYVQGGVPSTGAWSWL